MSFGWNALMMRKLLSWLVKESEGTSLTDNILLFFLKIVYFGLRILLRIVLGRKKRDRLYVQKELDFGVFWYKFFKIKKGDGSKLFRFRVPKYGYEFYSRLNKDDFKLMALHEDEIIDQFCPKPGDTVVDVGAHIGLYTIIASKRVGPTGKVIAIEPDPENCNLLKRNVELNRLTNVIILECAAFSSNTKLKLYLPGKERGFTKLSTVMSNRTTTDTFLDVNGNTLDHLMLMQGLTQVNWIKIDVEGAELEVLKGGTATLSTSKDIALLIEVHNVNDIDLHTVIVRYLQPYDFHLEFEKKYTNGERHVLFRKKEIAAKSFP
jgi:FkbM family methyltransferase